jgi:undecaprenyl-diphosphatase
MDSFQAVILGIIQGLTEFLPISSTAHLRIIPELLGWSDPGAAFTAVIQWGTFVASVLYFRHDIARLTLAWLAALKARRPFGTQDARLAWMIAVGTVPIVAFGLLLRKQIKGPFRSLYAIAGVMIGLAVVLFLAELMAAWRRRRGNDGKSLQQVGWVESLTVGFAQVLALVPGASRSGVTITGGLFAGLSRETAARYSFLLSLPAVFGAGLYELYKDRHELLVSHDSVANLVIATVVSGVVGYAAIAFLMHYLRTRTTAIFIVYRVALGALLLVLLGQGLLQPLPPESEGQPAQTASSISLNSR